MHGSIAVWMLARRQGTEQAEDKTNATSKRRTTQALVAVGVPILGAVLVHGAYNYARFGSLVDAGYSHILVDPALRPLMDQFGLFSLHFLPQNLQSWLVAGPFFQRWSVTPDWRGMSLFLTTPFLFLVFLPRRLTALEWVAQGCVIVIALPSLLYFNGGWVQFGQRFALDWIALALVACALASKRAPAWLVGTLTVSGIAVNVWGTLWFQANYPH
jgi:hypothetical protein